MKSVPQKYIFFMFPAFNFIGTRGVEHYNLHLNFISLQKVHPPPPLLRKTYDMEQRARLLAPKVALYRCCSSCEKVFPEWDWAWAEFVVRKAGGGFSTG